MLGSAGHFYDTHVKVDFWIQQRLAEQPQGVQVKMDATADANVFLEWLDQRDNPSWVHPKRPAALRWVVLVLPRLDLVLRLNPDHLHPHAPTWMNRYNPQRRRNAHGILGTPAPLVEVLRWAKAGVHQELTNDLGPWLERQARKALDWTP